MMWERATELVTAHGTKFVFNSTVNKIHLRDGKAVAVTAETDGVPTRYECSHVISSMPISALLRAMDPPVPPEVRAAADGLRYRDFITVALVMREDRAVPDNWIYIDDAGVEGGRNEDYDVWYPY